MERVLKSGRFVLCAAVMLTLLLSISAAATVYYVNGKTGDDTNSGTSWSQAVQTIEASLSLASSGDQVWVAAGEYICNAEVGVNVALYGGFIGTETTLSQRNWAKYGTILSAKLDPLLHIGTVVNCTSGSVVDGFTIRYGDDMYGSGIFCSGAATIANNLIYSNTSDYGAIYCTGDATIVNNTLCSNYAYVSCGGIYCNGSSPVIKNNVIYVNAKGGIYCTNSCSATIISNNIAGNLGYGGTGLGVACYSGSSVVLLNNTIADNEGSGIYCNDSSPIITNNIVALNESGIQNVGSGTPILRNNDVYNTSNNYINVSPGQDDISSNPLFEAIQHYNYHLSSYLSPCYETGWTSAPGLSEYDIDGQYRINMIDAGTEVEIGADEVYDGPPSTVIQPTISFSITSYPYTVDINSPIPQARIFYTTNGTDATANDAQYTGPIVIDRTTTVKAIGYRANWTLSSNASATITLPEPITNFSANYSSQYMGALRLSWNNPISNFTGVKILSKTTGYPTSPTDGTVVYNGSGTLQELTDITPSTTYYFAAFVYNNTGLYSRAATLSFTTDSIPSAPAITSPSNGSTVTTLSPTITWSGGSYFQRQIKLVAENDPNAVTSYGYDSGLVFGTGNSAAVTLQRNYTVYYVFMRLASHTGWGPWSAAGHKILVNTNSSNGIVYLADALPSASGWSVYDGTYENGYGITSTIVNDGGNTSWKLTDNSSTDRCKERKTVTNISFDTGASMAVRMRVSDVFDGPTYNFGISNGNVGGMFIRLYTNAAWFVDINGTVRGIFALDATKYHKYQITVKNATQGNNATATWKVYVDGALQITWTGAGTDNGFDGFMIGHAGTGATGTWYYDWVAGRSDGAFSPAQWDPIVKSPGLVSNFSAVEGNFRNFLTWQNPSGSVGTLIRCTSTSPGPKTPSEGTLVYDGPGTSFTHKGLENYATYFYTAFAYDNEGNYSSGASLANPTVPKKPVLEASSLYNYQYPDGYDYDWNFEDFTTTIRASEAGPGSIALIGYENNKCYYSGMFTGAVLPTNSADHTAQVYMTHDVDCINFLVKINDDDIQDSNPASLNWLNDCVEFYIDPGYDGGANAISDSTSDVQLVIDVNNQKNVYMCTDTYKNQILAGVTSSVNRVANGWDLEVQIAKNAFSPALPLIGSFGLDFNFRDNDNNNDPALSTIYTWADKEESSGFPSKIPNRWGTAELFDVFPPSTPDPATPEAEASCDGVMTFSWAPTTDVGDGIYMYEWIVTDDPDYYNNIVASGTVAASGPLSTTVVVTEPGTYYCRVRAYDTTGPGQYSYTDHQGTKYSATSLTGPIIGVFDIPNYVSQGNEHVAYYMPITVVSDRPLYNTASAIEINGRYAEYVSHSSDHGHYLFTYQFKYGITDDDPEGQNVAQFTATDVCGHSHTYYYYFNIDRVLPTLTITEPTGTSIPEGYVTISVAASDDRSGVDKVYVMIDNNYWQEASYDEITEEWCFTDWYNYEANSSHTIHAYAVDAAGNYSMPVSQHIGAPEEVSAIFVDCDVTASGDGSSWSEAMKTIDEAMAIAAAGQEVWVAEGTYDENVVVPSNVSLFGGFEGNETLSSQRDWVANETIIDGDGTDNVVTVNAPNYSSSSTNVVDGFTIHCGDTDVYCLYGSPTISHNKIMSGGVTAANSSAVIRNNLISSNGTAVYCASFASPSIINNTIVGNGSGAAAYYFDSPGYVGNNIIVGFSTGVSAHCVDPWDYVVSPGIGYNCLYNVGTYYSLPRSNPSHIDTNLESVNPLFVDATNGDYRLQTNSPCIDAGSMPALFGLNAFDLDNNSRLMHSRVDIGAYEHD